MMSFTAQQIASALFAGGALIVGAKIMYTFRKHLPIKYGEPGAREQPPDIPENEFGSFHASYDGSLWLFERSWEPQGQVSATLRIIHGTVDHSGVYDELGKHLARAGIAVFASDMRGWGVSDGEQLFFNSIETFVEDVRVDHLRVHANPRYRNVKHRFILGKSLGGLIAAHTVVRHPNLFQGLIGLSGAFEISSMLPSAPIMFLLQLVSAISPKLPLKPVFNPKLIVSDEKALRKWKEDPLVARGKATVTYITTIASATKELQPLIPSIQIPMLMMWGTADQVVSLKGHRDLLELSGSTDTELKRYEGALHNILAEPMRKEAATEDILQWILARCSAPP